MCLPPAFVQVEDLQRIEGITAKRFSSFLKVSFAAAVGFERELSEMV